MITAFTFQENEKNFFPFRIRGCIRVWWHMLAIPALKQLRQKE
jgi:hypothetical protein